MILKAAHSFGNLRLDNDAGAGDKSSASRPSKNMLGGNHRSFQTAAKPKTNKDGGTHKNCAEKNKLIRPQPKPRL